VTIATGTDLREELRQLVAVRAFKFGTFTLTSGRTSDYYVDGKQVTLDGRGLYLVARFTLEHCRDLGIDAVGGLTLGADPTLAVLTAVSVVLRCAEFGLAKPARDMLYTVLPTAAKYQSKNAIDTALYRGSDMASGWIQALIGRLGVGLAGWGWIAAALSVVLTTVAALVGRDYRRRGGR